MTGFITIETRRELRYQYLSEQSGMTVEEVEELYKGCKQDEPTTRDEVYKKHGCIPYGLM